MKKRSVLARIGVIALIMFVATVFLSTAILFVLFKNRAMESMKKNLGSQISSCIVELEVYGCFPDLMDYWADHGAELSVPPFTDIDRALRWAEEHASFNTINAEAVTSEEFNAMPPEQQKLFAEHCYNRIFMELTLQHLTAFDLDDIMVLIPGEGDTARILMHTNKEMGKQSPEDAEQFFPGQEAYDLSLQPGAKEFLFSELGTEASSINSDIELFRSPADGEESAAIYGRIGKDGEQKGIMSVAVSMDELIRGVWSDVLRFAGWISAAMAAVLAVLLLLFYLNALRPTLKIQKNIRSYTEKKSREELSENLSAMKKKPDEFGSLSRDIDEMAGEIQKHYENVIELTAKQERLDAELDVAKGIQAEQLPSIFPAFPERTDFDIFASMTPAKEVGGDFYDFFFLDEDHLALVIADVSGKGVPAALFMMIAKLLIRSSLQNGMAPGEALEKINNRLLENNKLGFFVTVWLAVIDLKTGDGIACNAGHEHPALKKRGEDYQLVIYRHSMAVSFLPDQLYEEHKFHLDPGDRIFVYTDGVPEAQNEKEELFGTDRMIECLNQNSDATPEQAISGMMESIRSFSGEAEQFDDITMLCFLYLGKGKEGAGV